MCFFPVLLMPYCPVGHGKPFCARSEVDTADFMKCSETTMHDNVTAYTFFKISGDTDGVVITEENGVKTYKLLCQDQGPNGDRNRGFQRNGKNMKMCCIS